MHRPDTQDHIQKIYDDKIRALTCEQRFFKGLALVHLSRDMMIAGILSRAPHKKRDQIRETIFTSLYGDLFSEHKRAAIRNQLNQR